nr:hypothetical protein [Tanacetum cinerariifolium]
LQVWGVADFAVTLAYTRYLDSRGLLEDDSRLLEDDSLNINLASMIQSPKNTRFNMKLKKLIAEHPDQEKLKSKKVKLEALGYEMD